MDDREIRNHLREEYFGLRAEAQKAVDILQAHVRHALIPLTKELRKHEKLEVIARVKDCESAIGKLLRDFKLEGRVFDRDAYSLRTLRDLAAVRVMVFPVALWHKANDVLVDAEILKNPVSKPINLDGDPDVASPGELLTYKYSGEIQECPNLIAELQITPMLVGLFWSVEHSAIYKPDESARRAAKLMKAEKDAVCRALLHFDEKYQQFLAGLSQQDSE